MPVPLEVGPTYRVPLLSAEPRYSFYDLPASNSWATRYTSRSPGLRGFS